MSHTLVVDCGPPYSDARVHFDGAFDGTAVIQWTTAEDAAGRAVKVDAVALRTGAFARIPAGIPAPVFLRVVSRFTEAYCLHTFLQARDDETPLVRAP